MLPGLIRIFIRFIRQVLMNFCSHEDVVVFGISRLFMAKVVATALEDLVQVGRVQLPNTLLFRFVYVSGAGLRLGASWDVAVLFSEVAFFVRYSRCINDRLLRRFLHRPSQLWQAFNRSLVLNFVENFVPWKVVGPLVVNPMNRIVHWQLRFERQLRCSILASQFGQRVVLLQTPPAVLLAFIQMELPCEDWWLLI